MYYSRIQYTVTNEKPNQVKYKGLPSYEAALQKRIEFLFNDIQVS